MIRLAASAALLLCVLSTVANATYTVVVDMTRPQTLTMSLTVSKNDRGPRTLILRGTAWGLKSQVLSPRCGKIPLVQDKRESWIVPGSCERVTWNVRPQLVLDGTADVSNQATLLFQQPQWLLISEPTSILRVAGDATPSTLSAAVSPSNTMVLGATRVDERSWRLPSLDNAPEFFVVGKITTHSRNVGPFLVRYVADNVDRVERLGLEAMHEKILGYLANVAPPPSSLPASELALLVVWVGIDERNKHAGGSAGSRSFIANYIVGERNSASVDAARTLMIVAHEQFHQLADLVRGSLPPLPVWLNESLATYYGLKALAQATTSAATESLSVDFIDPSRSVTSGLLELDRRRAAGDGSAYPRIYEQGATFWAELDTALRAHSGPANDLDALIPDLLRSNAEEGGRLPGEFVAKLRASLGPQADELLGKYVGN